MKSLHLILSHISILRLFLAVRKFGQTLLALSFYAKNKHSFIHYQNQKISYDTLHQNVLQRAYFYFEQYQIRPQSKVIIVAENSIDWMATLFACSALGADIYLINPQLKKHIISKQVQAIQAQFVFGENEIGLSNIQFISLATNLQLKEIPKSFLQSLKNNKSNISNFTSGTTGIPKSEKRKTNISDFIVPFRYIFSTLKLNENKNILVQLSFSHGFGLAALLLALTLKKNIIILSPKEKIITTIKDKNIDCWLTLPTLIERFVEQEKWQQLQLKIISGSEALSKNIVEKITQSKSKLYNLYGTSESGILSIATPEMLLKYPDTIGKPLPNMEYKFLISKHQKSELYVKTKWASLQNQSQFYATKDIVTENENGFWFYKGRINDTYLKNGHISSVAELKEILDNNFEKLEYEIIKHQADTINLHLVINSFVSEKDVFIKTMQSIVPKHLYPEKVDFL